MTSPDAKKNQHEDVPPMKRTGSNHEAGDRRGARAKKGKVVSGKRWKIDWADALSKKEQRNHKKLIGTMFQFVISAPYVVTVVQENF